VQGRLDRFRKLRIGSGSSELVLEAQNWFWKLRSWFWNSWGRNRKLIVGSHRSMDYIYPILTSVLPQEKELREGVMEKAVVVSQWTSMLNIIKVQNIITSPYN
jgi:hypothetical protein